MSLRPPVLSSLLRGIARLALHRPFGLLAAVVVPSLLAALLAVGVPLDLSFTGILDRRDPQVDRYFDTIERTGLGGSLLVLLEGPEERLDELESSLAARLSSRPGVEVVLGSPPSDWLRDQLPWLVDAETFDLWLRSVERPLDVAGLAALAQRATILERRLQPVENARLLEVRLDRDPLRLEVGNRDFFALEATIHDWSEAAGDGVVVGLSGLPAVAAQDQRRTLGAVERLTPLSLLVVLVLFTVVERRLLGLLAVALTLALAIAATLGLVGRLTGSLTVMESFFGVTVFGLGIDFAIHLIARQREERGRGVPFETALERTLTGSGRAIAAGGLTTAGAFLIVATAPDPIALHLGLSGGLGLLLCLLLVLTLLPAFWVLIERRRPLRGARTELPVPGLLAVATQARRHPTWTLLLTGLALAVALVGLPRLRLETDLQRVLNREVPALDTVERVQELFGVNGAPWIVTVGDLEQARAVTARFERHPLFSHADSAARLLAADTDERHRRLQASAGLIERRLAEGAALPALAESWRRLAAAARHGPPALDDLPESLRRRWVGDDGSLLVLAWARRSPLDGFEARQQRIAAQALAPGATSLGALLEAILVKERPWVWWVLVGILAFVVLLLLSDFREPRLALLALVPVLIGTALTLGILCWAGVAFNVMTVLVLPLILGLGVDDGIHVVHRIAEHGDETIEQATAAVARPIVMTTATTSASFAVLLFTDHPGLESMALVMLIGLPLCLLASTTTLPALAGVLLPERADPPPRAPGSNRQPV